MQLIAPTKEMQALADEIRSEAVPSEFQKVLAKADRMVSYGRPEVMACLSVLDQAIVRAHIIKQLRAALTDEVMELFYPLMNTPLGFRTDKTKANDLYTVDQVRECIIEAMMQGLHPIGNEFNIISGRCYATKEGLARLVRVFPGLTDLSIIPGVPKTMNAGAVVSLVATFCINGLAKRIARDIPVKVNAGMGADAIIGKSMRKMLATVYGQLTGSEHAFPDGEVEDVGGIEAAPVSTANDRLEALKTAAQPAPFEATAQEPAQPEPAKGDGWAQQIEDRRKEHAAAKVEQPKPEPAKADPEPEQKPKPAPQYVPWPMDAKDSPATPGYWRRKLLDSAAKWLESYPTDITPEQMVMNVERALKIPPHNPAMAEAAKVKVVEQFKAAAKAVNASPDGWQQYAITGG